MAATRPVAATFEPLEERRLLSVPADVRSNIGVALQSTGKPIALDTDAFNHAVLVRFLPNSTTLDPSFGAGGEVVTQLDAINAVAVGPGDKIFVAGGFTLARFNADGTPDTGFGSGTGSIKFLGETLKAVAVQPDGKVLVATDSLSSPFEPSTVHRFNLDGTPDATFGTAGAAPVPSSGARNVMVNDLLVESSGKIAVTGIYISGGSGPFIAQLTTGGVADGTVFDTQTLGGYRAIAEAPDGGLIALGRTIVSGSTFKTQLLRFLPNGQQVFAVDVPAPASHANLGPGDVALTSDHKIIISGKADVTGAAATTANASDFFLERFDLNGSLDPTFGTGGSVVLDTGYNESAGGALAVAPDDSIYLGGSSTREPTTKTSGISFGSPIPILPSFSPADPYRAFTADLFHLNAGGSIAQSKLIRSEFTLPNLGIEAEDFDIGGEGSAYHDTTAANEGGQYRTSEGVDIEPTTDAGGGYDVGWTHAGEYLQYSVNNPFSYTYRLDARVANYGAGGAFHVEIDGKDVTGKLSVPDTGGFQKYTDVIKDGVFIGPGDHVIRVVIDGQSQYGFGGNFNWFRFIPTAPNVSIQATASTVSEGGPGTAVFTITRDGDLTRALSVSYTVTGTAKQGTDYQNLFPIVIPIGQTSTTLVVTPVDDAISEGDETVIVNLESVDILRLQVSGQASVTIKDDEPPPTSGPYGGTPAALPGVIQLENFDTGGEGLAYHDTTVNNEGGAYRPNDAPDLEPTTDAGGGYDVGWTHTGEYLQYTVNVTQPGPIAFNTRVANYGAGARFHWEADGTNVTGSLAIPDTGGFQNWTTVASPAVSLTGGLHTLRLVIDAQSQYGFGGNFNSVQFTAPTTPVGQPFVNVDLPGTVQAENYDVGGEGVAYHDTSANNQGGAYRTGEGVDVEALPNNGGYAIDYAHTGEYTNYTVHVPAGGVYSIASHVANYGAGGAFRIEVDGVNVTGTKAVTNTNSFTSFTDVTAAGINLTAGFHVIKFVWESESQYGFAGNLDYFRVF